MWLASRVLTIVQQHKKQPFFEQKHISLLQCLQTLTNERFEAQTENELLVGRSDRINVTQLLVGRSE